MSPHICKTVYKQQTEKEKKGGMAAIHSLLYKISWAFNRDVISLVQLSILTTHYKRMQNMM